MINQEIWKSIKGYEGIYEISNFGAFRCLINGTGYRKREKRKFCLVKGYPYVDLKKREKIHILVMKHFGEPNIRNCQGINHIDGNKENNIIDNLEWATTSENIKHAFKIGLRKTINKKKIICITTGNIYESITQAANDLQVCGSHISEVCSGKYKSYKGMRFSYAK